MRMPELERVAIVHVVTVPGHCWSLLSRGGVLEPLSWNYLGTNVKLLTGEGEFRGCWCVSSAWGRDRNCQWQVQLLAKCGHIVRFITQYKTRNAQLHLFCAWNTSFCVLICFSARGGGITVLQLLESAIQLRTIDGMHYAFIHTPIEILWNWFM